MKCRWEDVSIDERGWRVVRCVRCQFTSKPTPHAHDRIFRTCTGLPLAHEWGHWLAIFFAVFGLTEEGYVWVKSRLGLKPACGCEWRKTWLNRIGSWFIPARRG